MEKEQKISKIEKEKKEIEKADGGVTLTWTVAMEKVRGWQPSMDAWQCGSRRNVYESGANNFCCYSNGGQNVSIVCRPSVTLNLNRVDYYSMG